MVKCHVSESSFEAKTMMGLSNPSPDTFVGHIPKYVHGNFKPHIKSQVELNMETGPNGVLTMVALSTPKCILSAAIILSYM